MSSVEKEIFMLNDDVSKRGTKADRDMLGM